MAILSNILVRRRVFAKTLPHGLEIIPKLKLQAYRKDT